MRHVTGIPVAICNARAWSLRVAIAMSTRGVGFAVGWTPVTSYSRFGSGGQSFKVNIGCDVLHVFVVPVFLVKWRYANIYDVFFA